MKNQWRKLFVQGKASLGENPDLRDHTKAGGLKGQFPQEEALESFVKQVMKIHGVHGSAVFVWRADEALDLVAHQGLADSFLESKVWLKSNARIVRKIREGQLWIHDGSPTGDGTGVSSGMINDGHTIIQAPIFHENRVLASLTACSRFDPTFNPLAVEIVSEVARYMGLVIARLQNPRVEP